VKAREQMRQNVINQYSIAMVSRDLSRLRTRRPNIYCGKNFSVDVASHTWERKFVCWSL